MFLKEEMDLLNKRLKEKLFASFIGWILILMLEFIWIYNELNPIYDLYQMGNALISVLVYISTLVIGGVLIIIFILLPSSE